MPRRTFGHVQGTRSLVPARDRFASPHCCPPGGPRPRLGGPIGAMGEGVEIAQEVAMPSNLQRVLELWRASERELAARNPESRDGSALATQVDRLRRLYQTITAHEQRELRRLKDPERTIVRSELLTLRSLAAAGRAEAALQRSRSARLAAD